MSSLWSWEELCTALSLEVVAGPDINGIDFDSRTIGPDELFLALPGDPGPRFNVAQRSNRDGHDFVESAVSNGAIGALVSQTIEARIPTLRVPDTIDALWELARFRRDQFENPVVAVTGSSGKTTLKSFLQQALPAFATQGSYNNYIGAPLSMAVTPKSASATVIEIGTNHIGEIEPLAKVASPDVAVVLNVLPVHIGNFNSIDELRTEKLSIAKGLRSGGTFVVHESLIQHVDKEHDTKLLSFGSSESADVRVSTREGTTCQIAFNDQQMTLAIPGGGEHRAETLAATAAVLLALNFDINRLKYIDEELPRGRGNVIEIGSIRLIDDSYNANPLSVRAAIASLNQQQGRKIAVIGQMNELGDESPEFHRGLAEIANKTDMVYCVGEECKPLHDALTTAKRYFDVADTDLETELLAQVTYGDTVLVKGSHSIFWEVNFVDKLAETIRNRFDC